jgi:hypothetical protein
MGLFTENMTKHCQERHQDSKSNLEIGVHHTVVKVDVPVVHELSAFQTVIRQGLQGPPLPQLHESTSNSLS